MSGLNQNASHIAKTTKLFINGEFPRTESGRSFPVKVHGRDQVWTHLCRASRKDLRNSVEAATAAFSSWSARTAYNRGQILYRMAEMMEGKRTEFVSMLITLMGMSEDQAQFEVDGAMDSFVYYAGFADKYSQVLASVNPVSGPFHNFTTPEPVGVVGLVYDKNFSLAELVSQICAVILSGNTLVVIWDQPGAAFLGELGEVFKTSDLPGGVINLLSTQVAELYKFLGQHLEIHSILCASDDPGKFSEFREMAVENMKRVVDWKFSNRDLSPIVAFTEAKTIWHPVGI